MKIDNSLCMLLDYQSWRKWQQYLRHFPSRAWMETNAITEAMNESLQIPITSPPAKPDLSYFPTKHRRTVRSVIQNSCRVVLTDQPCRWWPNTLKMRNLCCLNPPPISQHSCYMQNWLQVNSPRLIETLQIWTHWTSTSALSRLECHAGKCHKLQPKPKTTDEMKAALQTI